MEPGEFVQLLWEHKHPRWSSCGVYSSRRTNELRKEANFAKEGTIWFASPRERDVQFTVPCNCIPYTSILTKTWDQRKEQWSKEGEFVKGWRSALEELLRGGFLCPSEELDYLMGKQSFWLSQPKHRI
jgi:hypothetical protein